MTNEQRVLILAKKKGILRAQELDEADIPRVTLTRLCRSGKLIRLARGLYALPEADFTENHSLAETAKRVPNSVICLLSALQFHNLSTQTPFEIWIAINSRARKPNVREIPLRIVRFSNKNLHYGVEKHMIENVAVHVTDPAKTVADCFKFRNKVGLDVAIEALKNYRDARLSRDSLWKAMNICRVSTVMRPYMEAVD